MQAIIKRLLGIAAGLTISFIIVHYTRARLPYHMPRMHYNAVSIPAPSKKDEDKLDKLLKPYFHVAHTSTEPGGAAISSYRTYFRFPVSDVACMPPEVANRNQKIRGCPGFIYTEEANCFFLDSRYRGLLNLLKSPDVSVNMFTSTRLKTWRDNRDWTKIRDLLRKPIKK